MRRIIILAMIAFMLSTYVHFSWAGEKTVENNIAKGLPPKSYTASSSLSSNYQAKYAFDGLLKPPTKKWVRHSWLSTKDDSIDQWLKVDLGKVSSVTRVVIHWGTGSKNFSVQYSIDGTKWQDIASNQGSTAVGVVSQYPLGKPVQARYIRVFQKGGIDAAVHRVKYIGIKELEIYGEGRPHTNESGENLLLNSSFEEGKYPSGVPRAWHQETDNAYNPVAQFLKESHDGEFAISLKNPTHWHHQRPQYIWQRVPVKAGKTYCLSGLFKGYGVGYLYCQPMTKKGKDVGKPIEREFGITKYYTSHNLEIEIPKGATWVEVKIGVKRILTDLVADTLFFGLKEKKEEKLKGIKEEKELINIAALARISVFPPVQPTYMFGSQAYLIGMTGIEGVVDNDEETYPRHVHCAERMASFTFSFPSAIEIEKVRVLPEKVKSYILRGDRKGDGNFEEIILRREKVEEGWNEDSIRQNLCALRFEVEEGSVGYRSVGQTIKEIEILTPDKGKAKLLSESDWPSIKNKNPRVSPTPLVFSRLRKLPGNLFVKKKSSFLKGVTLGTWMWGFKPDPNFSYENNPNFDKMIKNLKEMKIDLAWLFTPTWNHQFLSEYYRGNTATYRAPMFPSEYADSMTFDALSPFCKAIHREGIKVVGMFMYSMLPCFEKELFLYPAEETSRYPEKKQRPSIIFGNHYKTNWTGLLKEMMKYGCDGVSICADEFYYKGHFLKTIPAHVADIAVYRKKYGYDIPKEEADTLKYRQWIMMRHQGLAELYKSIVDDLKKEYPNALTVSNFMVPTLSSHIEEQCIDFPLLGKTAGIDQLGSDYLGSFGYKYLTGCAGWRKSHIVDQGGTWKKDLIPKLRPIKQSGALIRAINYGLGGTTLYRYNYILMSEAAKKGVVEGFTAVEDLDKAGIFEATPPTSVALLYLRNSEDWYQIKSWYGEGFPAYLDRAVEGIRGFVAHRALGSFLMEKGIPYDLLFLDRHRVSDLSRYKILIVPFPYSLSEENNQLITKAVRKGSKLLIFEKQGETDEWGEPYGKPILESLIRKNQKRVFFFKDSLYDCDDNYKARIVGVLKDFQHDIPLLVENYGRKVEVSLLENRKEERYFLSLINWEHEKAPCSLELNLPAGRYQMLLRDEEGFKKVSLKGKDICTAEDLKKLDLQMEPGSFQVFIIEKIR